MAPPSAQEDNDKLDITCPNCNSTNVTVCEDSHGHFQVINCYQCGYKKECNLKD